MLRLDYRVIERLSRRHGAWADVHSAFLWTYIEGFASLNEGQHMTVETRYRTLLERRSNLVARVSQRDLASHLGVTESALSRIAKRVRDGEG